MFNKILQKELKQLFEKINERKDFINKFESSLKVEDKSLIELEEYIKSELTKRIKGYLDKEGFNFNKGRNREGSRVAFENDKLKIRGFKNHSFYDFDVIHGEELNEFLSSGLIEAREIIRNKLKEIQGVILDFKDKIKLKRGINIQYIDGEEIKKQKVKEIEISFNCEEQEYYNNSKYSYSNRTSYTYRNEKFEISVDGYTCRTNDCLYSDEIFNTILNLIERFKDKIKKVEQIKDKKRKELKFFVDKKIDKLIVLGNLQENEN